MCPEKVIVEMITAGVNVSVRIINDDIDTLAKTQRRKEKPRDICSSFASSAALRENEKPGQRSRTRNGRDSIPVT